MAFSLTEKEQIRYHMGYLNVAAAASLQFGLPAPVQMLFIVESAMDKILPEAENRVRTIISDMETIECQMREGREFLVANRLGDMELRKEHINQLEEEYFRWANRLAGQMGVPLYLYAEKFKAPRSGRGGMIPRE